MNRDEMIDRLATREPWDIIVIGGGATGMGVAIDSASRGYRTLLLEQADFGKGTSSRATKLVHGGVRYLAQGDIKLVREALAERTILLNNARHMVRELSFVLPTYRWWEKPFYGVGLKAYDWLAGRDPLQGSRFLSRQQALEHAPNLEANGLRGGVLYHDGQFDDARLLICMARTAALQGAAIINYCPVKGLLKDTRGRTQGVVATDAETGREFEATARVVVNATGVFADDVRLLADPVAKRMIRPSQGIHVVVDRSFLSGDAPPRTADQSSFPLRTPESAILVPKTDDGRVLFVIPWHDHVVIGTTDDPVPSISLEPLALRDQVQFVLANAARYLSKDPTPADVKSVFAGLRPLVDAGSARTAALSRDHLVHVDPSGLVTITGGKWTTYRRMAQDTVDHAARIASLEPRPCVTTDLPIFGNAPSHHDADSGLTQWTRQASDPALPPIDRSMSLDEITRWAVKTEMARTVEDVLARRTRRLFLDARSAIIAAPVVAKELADLLHRDSHWAQDQVRQFTQLAEGYLIENVLDS